MSSGCCLGTVSADELSSASSTSSNTESCKKVATDKLKRRVINLHPLSKQILGSTIASSLTVLALNPLSVVKIQYQNLTLSKSHGILSTAAKIYKTYGVHGFWSGTTMGLVQAVPNTIVYMVTYEYCKANVFYPLSTLSPLLSGMAARSIAVTIMTPLELIRTIQSNGNKQSGFQISRNIYSKEGVKGLYKGWLSTLLRDAPYSGIYWYTFEFVREFIHSTNTVNNSDYEQKSKSINIESSSTLPNISHEQYLSQYFNAMNNYKIMNNYKMTSLSVPAVNFLSGGISAIIAACLTHPYDVIKTRRQLSTSSAQTLPIATTINLSTISSSNYSNPDKHINLMNIIRNEGIASLYRGLTMRLATVVPASAILVTVYEAIKYFE